MPGFICYIDKNFNENIELNMNNLTAMPTKQTKFKNAKVKYYSNKKFENDKVFYEDDNYFVCIEGVLQNSKQLINSFAAKNNFDLICKLFKQNPNSFPLHINGDFSGIIFDKKQKEWHFFNNFLGTKAVFYYFDEAKKMLVVSSNMNSIITTIKQTGYKPSLNVSSAYNLLTFGYMLGSSTLEDNIKRLKPGNIISYNLNTFKLKFNNYYKIPSKESVADDLNTIVNKLDEKFKNAIKLEFDKDIENNYKHIATISGGLDARICAFYAKKMGYNNVQSITYSQTDYIDETSSKKMASDLGNNFLFFSLDNGNFLKNTLKDVVVANDGLIVYAPISTQLAMQRVINFSNFGMLHTGQIGDAVLGSLIDDGTNLGLFSSLLKNKIISNAKKVKSEYANNQNFLLYNRGINSATNAYYLIQQNTEFTAAHLNYDFFDYSLKIPSKYKVNQKLYKLWYSKKVKEATKYICTKTRTKVDASLFAIYLEKIRWKICRTFNKNTQKFSMNPYEYWCKINLSLNKYALNYYNQNKHLLEKDKELYNDCKNMFNNASFIEKSMVLTLLQAIKYHGLNL